MLMVDMGFLAFLSILVLEISDKYGPGGLRNLIRGRYNHPKKENRIFLFLDMNDSTVIAEHIGHEKYFNLLKEFFSDITEPILNNGGHIYQYVGDEIVLSWFNDDKGKQNCLNFVRDAYLSYKKKFEQVFSKRLTIAKIIQGIILNKKYCKMAFSIANTNPSLLPYLVKITRSSKKA